MLPEVGEIVTSLDMAGCSLTLSWLDDELEELWTAPADTPAFRRGSVAELPRFAAMDRSASELVSEAVSVGSPESQRAAVTVRAMLAAMLRTVVDAEEELGRIDAVAGDGDHGVGMVRGLRAANAAASAQESTTGVSGVLRASGAAWADKAGGTSGVLWGAILTAIGGELGDTDAPDRHGIARSIVAGARRPASPWQMRDRRQDHVRRAQALRRRTCRQRRSRDEAATGLAGCRRAGKHPAVETAALVPQLGRARPLAERSVGTPDAGATSMAMIIGAVGETLAIAIGSASHVDALSSR